MRKSLKQMIVLAAAASMTVTAVAGCSAQTTPTESTPVTEQAASSEEVVTTEPSTEVAVVKREVVACPTDYVSEDMMKLGDAWAGSQKERLASVMKKAESGEKVTVAVIGGSITQGTISNGTADSEVAEKKMYAEVFHDWWTQTFPDTEIEFVNAGIGATDSYLGVHRVQKDVLDYKPDLVLVEFSVNDSDSMACKITYDNLVRTIALSETNPAVMLLFMGQTNGSSAQTQHVNIGFRYKLPMVSYKNVMDQMITDGVYTAEEMSRDQVHPSALGHRITGEIIWKYLNSVYEVVDSFGDPEPFDFKVATKEIYTNGKILDSTSLTPDEMGSFEESEVFYVFPNDYSSKEGEGGLKFTLSFKNLGALYYCQTNGKGAYYDVYIDGEKVTTLNADFKGGWGNYAQSKECYTSDEVAEHTVEFKIADDSVGTEFTLLGLLVSE